MPFPERLMTTDVNEKRGFVKNRLRRVAFRREGRYRRGEEFVWAFSGEGAAAHERAVMTVKLTLLLLAVGIILFLFNGLGSAHPEGLKNGGHVEYLK